MSIDNAAREEWDRAAYNARLAECNAESGVTPRDVERLNQLLDQPFGEVPLVTRAYVFLLHQMGKVHITRNDEPDVCTIPAWRPAVRYQVRAVETPKTKPSIDWSHVAPQYKWLARDANGTSYVYRSRPLAKSTNVWGGTGDLVRADVLTSYTPGDCDWKDSLVERPAGV